MGIPSIIMKEIFSFSGNNNYNLRSGTRLTRPSLHMTHHRTVSITNLGANIWELVTQNIKETIWIPKKCLFHFCKTIITQAGFL